MKSDSLSSEMRSFLEGLCSFQQKALLIITSEGNFGGIE
jgi:hypothetical protein